jgi:hypothetical protein
MGEKIYLAATETQMGKQGSILLWDSRGCTYSVFLIISQKPQPSPLLILVLRVRESKLFMRPLVH